MLGRGFLAFGYDLTVDFYVFVKNSKVLNCTKFVQNMKNYIKYPIKYRVDTNIMVFFYGVLIGKTMI